MGFDRFEPNTGGGEHGGTEIQAFGITVRSEEELTASAGKVASIATAVAGVAGAAGAVLVALGLFA